MSKTSKGIRKPNHPKHTSKCEFYSRVIWGCVKVGLYNVFAPFLRMTDVGYFTAVLAFVASLTACILYETDQASRQAQRAFLYVSDTKTLSTISNSGDPLLRLFPQWTNSGDTPTKKLKIFSFCGTDVSGFDFRASKDFTPDIIGPKQTKANGNCDAIPNKIEKKSGLVTTFAVGAKAIYYDVFNPNVAHITEFCATFPVTQVYDPQKGTVTMSVGGTFTYCPKHNCADEECPTEDQ